MTFFYACGTQFTEGYLQEVVIYRSTGDCYTMEDNVSSSLSQLLLPNCIVQAEARPYEPFLSHHRIVMFCTSHEQINTAAAILGLINHGMSGVGVNTPPRLWLLHSFSPSFHDGPWALEGMVFYLESVFFSILSSCGHPACSLPAEPALCSLWGVPSMGHPDNCQHHPTPRQNSCLSPLCFSASSHVLTVQDTIIPGSFTAKSKAGIKWGKENSTDSIFWLLFSSPTPWHVPRTGVPLCTIFFFFFGFF